MRKDPPFFVGLYALGVSAGMIGVEQAPTPGVPKPGPLPSPPKVDQNDTTGQSARSTRLADQEKRVKAPDQRVSWVNDG
jgi:hypothetical protein